MPLGSFRFKKRPIEHAIEGKKKLKPAQEKKQNYSQRIQEVIVNQYKTFCSQSKSNPIFDGSYLFSDPIDNRYILLWNVNKDNIRNLTSKFLRTVRAKNYKPLTQDFQKEHLSFSLLKLNNKQAFVRLNIRALQQHDVIASSELFNELVQQSRPWPQELLIILQSLTANNRTYTDDYLAHLALQQLRDAIQSAGYQFDDDHFFITKKSYDELSKQITKINQQFTPNNASSFTDFNYLFGRHNNIAAFSQDHKMYSGYKFSKSRFMDFYKKYGITPIDTQLLANVTAYDNVEKRAAKKSVQQKALRISNGKKFAPSYENTTDEPLADVLREYDLSNPNHRALLPKALGRPIIFYEDDKSDKLNVKLIHVLDHRSTLGSKSRPYGLVANQTFAQEGDVLFKPGEIICDYGGKRISMAEANQRKGHHYMLEIEGEFCIIGDESLGGLANGSSSVPNAYYEVVEDKKGNKKIVLVAAKEIRQGEQILVNYENTEGFYEVPAESEIKGITGEIYLNPYCNHKTFDEILKERHYTKLPWNEKLKAVSQHFYGDECYDLYATPLIKAILADDVEQVMTLLNSDLGLLYDPILRVDGENSQAAPKEKQNLVYSWVLAAYLGSYKTFVTLMHQGNLLLDIQKTADGRCALHEVLESPSPNKLIMLSLLIRNGAQITIQDREENTPLHICALYNLSREIHIIFDYCFKNNQGILPFVSYINKNNYDFLTLALDNNHVDIIELFLQYVDEISIENDEKYLNEARKKIFSFGSFLTKEQYIAMLKKVVDAPRFLALIEQYASFINADFIALAREVLQPEDIKKPMIKQECAGDGRFFSGKRKWPIKEEKEESEAEEQLAPKRQKTIDGREQPLVEVKQEPPSIAVKQEPLANKNECITPPGGTKLKRLRHGYEMHKLAPMPKLVPREPQGEETHERVMPQKTKRKRLHRRDEMTPSSMKLQ